MKTKTKTLIKALWILAEDILSGDGVANACIAEAAERIEELDNNLEKIIDHIHSDEIGNCETAEDCRQEIADYVIALSWGSER